jgi:hypothetical protein
VAGICAVAGGSLWLVKQVVIAVSATGAAPPENAAIAASYLAGLALMLVGAGGPAARVLRDSRAAVWVPAAVVSAPVIFFGVQAAADGLVDALAGPGAHWWWEGEGGIVLTALVFLALGAVLLAGRRRSRALATAS